MYLGKYGDPGEVEKAGYAGGSFQTARRGAYGRPYSVRENYNSLFRASPFPRQPTPALSARTMPADSPTRLCEIIDVEITGKDERVYCFAVEHAD